MHPAQHFMIPFPRVQLLQSCYLLGIEKPTFDYFFLPHPVNQQCSRWSTTLFWKNRHDDIFQFGAMFSHLWVLEDPCVCVCVCVCNSAETVFKSVCSLLWKLSRPMHLTHPVVGGHFCLSPHWCVSASHRITSSSKDEIMLTSARREGSTNTLPVTIIFLSAFHFFW